MKMSIGQTIEMIYLDKAGKITQRKIEILGIRAGRIRATCLTTGAPRVFLAAGILSWQPVSENRHAG
jgi:predicted DNA-binding transcriptional regulator YafY